jgi:phage N-6-adenine-methyltransferase
MGDKYRPTAFADVKGAATKIQSVDWHTPPEVFDKLDLKFDIDVASPVGGVDWIPAKKYYTEQDDGLAQDWEGTVWCNPPYGRYTRNWLEKFVNHGDGIALVFARTDTLWFHNYVLKADALLFTKGRLKFINPERNDTSTSASGSLFVACGSKSVEALKNSNMGWFINLGNNNDIFNL